MEIHVPIKNDSEHALLHHAKKHQVPCMSGATEAYLLHHLMKYKPTYCLEIGSAIGYSTSRIARTIHQWSGHLISFEISYPSYRLAMWHQRQQQLRNITLYHHTLLASPLNALIQQPRQFVFMDAMKSEYGAYLEYILPRCKRGATIICDDVLMYQDRMSSLYDVIKQYNLSYQEVPLEDNDSLLLITV